MAQAALSYGISHQLCMSLPSQIMDTLLLPAVTNARASPDNQPGVFDNRWKIGYTSLLMWPLEVQPFFDNTWTEADESFEYGHNRSNVQLQVILSILTAGPHGISDEIGHTNSTRVLQTCTQNGSLLHADKPATPIDAMFSPSSPYRPAGEIWQTHSRHGELLWRYVLAVDVNESFAMHTQHLWPAKVDNTSSSRTMVMSWHSRHLCAGADAGCARLWEGAKGPFPVQTSSESAGENGFELLVIAPAVFTTSGEGIALLGEPSKVVSVSGNRFSGMARTDTGLQFELHGAPGEAVHLSFVTFATPTAAAVQHMRSVLLDERGVSAVTLPAGGSSSPQRLQSLKTDDVELPFTLTKFDQNPVIGPSGIPGSQDACGARDMGMQLAGKTLNLVYSGYSNCDMGSNKHCGSIGCCQLMFSTLSLPPVKNATRLGTIVPPPGVEEGFFNITTDAFMLYDDPLWHMWATEMPIANSGLGRNIGHLTVPGTEDYMPTSGWTYENRRTFSTFPVWSPDSLDEPRVYPKEGGGWIMYLGSQNNPGNPLVPLAVKACWCVGFATSASLNGPWALSPECIIGSHNSSGYQAEAFVSFKYGQTFYVITNSLGTDGFDRGDWLKNVKGDLWSSSSQTQGFKLLVPAFVPRSGVSSNSPKEHEHEAKNATWPCPADFPPPDSKAHFICYNESTFATAGNGPCGSWCTDCAAVGDQPLWCDNGTKDLCAGHEGVTNCPAAPAWDAGFTYTTAQTGYDLGKDGSLWGAYMGGKGELPGAGPISIGLYELKLKRDAGHPTSSRAGASSSDSLARVDTHTVDTRGEGSLERLVFLRARPFELKTDDLATDNAAVATTWYDVDGVKTGDNSLLHTTTVSFGTPHLLGEANFS